MIVGRRLFAVAGTAVFGLVGFGSPQAQAAVSFVPATSNLSVPGGPGSVVIGDYDGDGVPDLLTANSSTDSVTILLGNGIGGYTPAPVSPVAVGDNPVSIVTGDFDGDNRLDFATANLGSDTVSIGLRHPQVGLFVFTESVGDAPIGIVVSDLNGDAKPDLATANSGTEDVTVLLNKGSGFFDPCACGPVPTGFEPTSIAVGDLNGDKKPDLATVHPGPGRLTVLLGDGSGDFAEAPGSPIANDQFTYAVGIADFNGDSKPDLVAAGGAVLVLLGDGRGAFTPAPGMPPSASSSGIGAIGDLNADGSPDLALTYTGAPPGGINVLLSDGAGSFTRGPSTQGGEYPADVAIGDLNGDGEPDFATANATSNNVTVVYNRNTPVRALPPGPFAFGEQPASTLSLAQAITVRSTTDAALRVRRVAITGPNSADFLVISDDCSGERTPVGSVCTVEVRFAPQNAGAKIATLSVFDNAQNGSGGVPLTGTGIVTPLGPAGPVGPTGPRGPAGPNRR